MKYKMKFDLPEFFEATIFGIIELFRCYFVTLFLLLFRPRKYRQVVVKYLQTGEDQNKDLSRPLTFVLINWLFMNIYAPFLAKLGRGIQLQYLLPNLREALKVEVLVIHFLAPLVALFILCGFFKILFLISRIKIAFSDVLMAIAYPFGFTLLVVVPYPDIRLIIPQLLGTIYLPNSLSKLLTPLVALYAFWILFARVYQIIGDLQPDRRRMLKWTIIITLGLLWSAGTIVLFCLGR